MQILESEIELHMDTAGLPRVHRFCRLQLQPEIVLPKAHDKAGGFMGPKKTPCIGVMRIGRTILVANGPNTKEFSRTRHKLE